MIFGTIEVNNLKVFAHIGVYDQERKVGNLFDVTVHVVHPLDGAVADRLDGSLNYAEIVRLVKEQMTSREARMLENVAQRIGSAIKERYPLTRSGFVRVAKLTPPLGEEVASVAVRIAIEDC